MFLQTDVRIRSISNSQFLRGFLDTTEHLNNRRRWHHDASNTSLAAGE